MKKIKVIGTVLLLGISSMLLLAGCTKMSEALQAPYEVSLEESFICNSASGRLLVINFKVKNTDKEYMDARDVIYDIGAKLDGESMKDGYLMEENSKYIEDEKIKSNATGKAQAVFQIGDKKEGIVELIGVVDAINGDKQFEILKEKIDLSKVEEIKVKSKFELTIDKVVKTDDGEGGNIVILDMTFTNNSKETVSFRSAVDLDIFQNGKALKSGHLPYNHPAENEEVDGNDRLDIQDGTGISVREVFLLNDASAPLEVKVMESGGYEKVVVLEKEVKIQE